MICFYSLLLSLSVVTGVLASPRDLILPRTVTWNETGYAGNYYYSFNSVGFSDVVYNPLSNGSYTVEWDGASEVGDESYFIAGMGWSTGSSRTIDYSASYDPNGGSYLSVYGLFINPMVEYYIVESWDIYNPATGSGILKGTVTSDGGTYGIYQVYRRDEIDGATWSQYWSIREQKRTSGTVTTANHFAAWRDLNLPTGTFEEQLVAVEAWMGNGTATVTLG